MEVLKALIETKSRFVKNEVEACRLANEAKLTRLELEQKEMFLAELAKGNNGLLGGEEASDKRRHERIQARQEQLKAVRQEVRDKDLEVEMLEILLKQ